MNKDMINIDDFVREKLNGHPQKDDSAAAWLKMKELLDKEKPEKVAPFMFRWRKPMAFLGAAILLSALCVGGYELNKLRFTNNNNTPVVIDNSNKTSSKSSTNNYNASNPISNQTPTLDTESTLEFSLETDIENNKQSNTTGNVDKRSLQINKKTANNGSENQYTNPAKSNRRLSTRNKNKLETSHIALATPAPSENKLSKTNITKTENQENNTDKGLNQQKPIDKSNLASNKNSDLKKSELRNRKEEFAAKNSVAGRNPIAKNESVKLKESNTTLAVNTQKNDEEKAIAHSQDSIPTTTIITKEKSSKGFPRKTISQSDTIASGKIALPNTQADKLSKILNNTQANESKQSTAQGQNKQTTTSRENRKDEFASKTPSTASKPTNNDELKNTITTAKKEKSKAAKWFDNLNLPQAAADAKRDLKNAQFYAGFSAGANYSISNNNNFQGVQFGPTGELVFNKHWSLFGAIKYFNRSGGKKTVNDSYAKEIANDTPSISGANWYYKVHSDSTNRFFNFSTLHSFELPITIRYAFQKFYIMTGINLAYYLGVNVEEVKKSYSPINEHFVQTNSTKPILKESKPTLATSDFGSKFGVGYVVGAGYQITPSWQTDLRIVNTFWDNSKGNGAQKLSKDFYKLPSLQISIGYQFNRGKSKPTFGPTDNH